MVVGNIEESTQVAVIGSGTGGYVAAIRLAQLGKEAVLISEDAKPGGVCLLKGCIPSKALIEVTRLKETLSGAEIMGLEVKGAKINVAKMQSWRQGIVDKLSGGVSLLLKNHGVEHVVGRARFTGPNQLQVQGESGIRNLKFEQAIIATGSRPRPLKGWDPDGKRLLTSTEALTLTEIPEHLLVIGGGYIGLELCGVYRRLGSEITVVEATDQLLPGLDPELLRPLKKRLEEQKVTVHLNTLATAYSNQGKGLRVTLKNESQGEMPVDCSHVLIAVGRVPNSEDLGLEKLGLAPDEKGFIPVSPTCQTQVPHIYAIGDVAGGMMLAHKASREGKVAAAHIAGEPDAFDNQVPAVIFTDPEIAYVGLSVPEAKAKGIETITGMFPFAALGRALTLNDTTGFVKIIAEASTHRVIGVQMTGPHVSDLIAEATLALEMGARLEDIDLTIHAHPTLPEAVAEAAEAAFGMAIHRYQKRRIPK